MTKILVVDDHPTNRKLVTALLSFEGYELCEAPDGMQGLEMARRERPELVISDILMPTMDGYEFVRRLRADPQFGNPSVIFYTAHYHEAEARSLAEQCRVARVIVKPCEAGVFVKTVAEVLRGAGEPPADPSKGDFDVEHLRVLTDKLAQTADRLSVAKSRSDALTELNLQLASERDRAALVEKVCAGARELLGARFAVLALGSRTESRVQHFAATGVAAEASALLRPSLTDGLLGRVFADRAPVRAAKWDGELGLPAGYPQPSALLAVPVSSLTHTYGWLCLGDKIGADGFNAEDERVLGILGAQLGRIYENGSLYEEVQNHAAQLLVEMDERERATGELRVSEARFRQIAENVEDVFFIVSPDFTESLYVSPAAERVWGRPMREFYAKPLAWADALHPDDRERVLGELRATAAAMHSQAITSRMEFRIVRPDGSVRWLLGRTFPIVDDRGAIVRSVGVCTDITERKLAEEKVEHLNRVHAMLSGINSLIVRATDRDELLWSACRLAIEEGKFRVAWCGLLDEQSGEVRAAAWAGEAADMAAATVVNLRSPAATSLTATAMHTLRPAIVNDMTDEGAGVLGRGELVGRGYRAGVGLPLVVAGKAVGCIVFLTDEAQFFNEEEMRLLTELAGDVAFALDHIDKSERLRYLAYYDSVTGLANRTLFGERLAQQVTAAQRAESQFAVLVVDPERLDTFTDTLGRTAADQLLRELATRFARCVGGENLAARTAGTQLAALIPGLRAAKDANRAVEDLWRDWLGQPFQVGGHEIALTARAGIALFPADGSGADELLRNAEAALNNAKTNAKDHSFYAPHLTEQLAERLALERNLRRALDQEEFVLHYQPKVDLETRRIKGVEALLRWQNAQLGLVPPARFIPLLEETGMIVEVGAWAFRQATLDRSQWLERRLHAPRVAVNVSTVQLKRDDFVRSIATTLKVAGGEAAIDIEVTESLLLGDAAENLTKLEALRELGVGIALDDFGTGYSSLGYLARLPVQTLKIDRSFIASMLDDPGAMTLVSTIISLARSLKMETVAEGVESEEQAKILRLLRCDQMQGYLVSKPLSFADMTTYLGRTR